MTTAVAASTASSSVTDDATALAVSDDAASVLQVDPSFCRRITGAISVDVKAAAVAVSASSFFIFF